MTGQGKNAIDILLAESLKEIATKHPIEKITIKEITDKAGVIRPTFYNHFQDKFELLEWILKKDLLEPVHPLIQNGMISEAMVLLFSNIEKERAFYTRAIKLEGPVSFQSIAQKCVQEELAGVFRDLSTGKKYIHSWLTPDLLASYYAQSMCFAVIEWIKMGMNIPPKEMADVYDYMLSHSMDDIMREL